MSWKPSLSTLYIVRAAVAALATCWTVAITAPAAKAIPVACPVTLASLVGDLTQQIQADMANRGGMLLSPRRGGAPTMVDTGSLTLFQREALSDPAKPDTRAIADTFYGKKYSGPSADDHFLPGDPSIVCLLEPGTLLLLTDGEKRRFRLLYAIDHRRQVVTIFEPSLKSSFLLPGNNRIGIKARIQQNGRHLPLLDLTFQELLLTLNGFIDRISPAKLFQTMERLSPDLSKSDNFLFWKYTRLLSTTDYSSLVETSIEMSRRDDLATFPRLKTLAEWANDYTEDTPSGFEDSIAKEVSETDLKVLQSQFEGRLVNYSKILPWTMKWLLLRRTGYDSGLDLDRALVIVDSFLKDVPSDNDFQIARAEILVRKKEFRDASAQLNHAYEQWTLDLNGATVASSKDRAMALLFSGKYDVGEQAILFHWRYQKIKLLQEIVDLSEGGRPPHDVLSWMADLNRQYVVGSLLLDFFPYLLEISFLANQKDAEEVLLGTIIKATNRPFRTKRGESEVLYRYAEDVYTHLVSRRSVSEYSRSLSLRLRRAVQVGRMALLLQQDAPEYTSSI